MQMFTAFRPAEFIGMYVDEGDIVVDVKESHIKTVKDFMKHKCQLLFQKHNIIIDTNVCFVEQNESHVFSGKRGAGLCFFPDSDDEIAQKLIHKNHLRAGMPLNKIGLAEIILRIGYICLGIGYITIKSENNL